MEYSLMIKGTLSEITAALRLLEGRRDEQDDAMPLRRFVWDCTGQMLAALNVIAYVSTGGQAIARTALQHDVPLADEGELNGVMGSIGRAWSKHIGADNPFLGKNGASGIVYQVDQDLAARLITLIASRTAQAMGGASA